MDDTLFRLECQKSVARIVDLQRPVWIYGAGRGGEILYDCLLNSGVLVKGFVDERYEIIKKKFGLPVVDIDRLVDEHPYLIVSLMDFHYDILVMLKGKGFSEDDVCFIAKYDYNPDEVVYKGATIGKYTTNYELFMMYAPNLVKEIGAFCSINSSSRCYANHPIDKVSTFLFRPVYSMSDYLMHDEHEEWRSISVGNDVWLGANTVVLPGVTIGDGAIIAAGAIVTKDVEPYSVVGGGTSKTYKI